MTTTVCHAAPDEGFARTLERALSQRGGAIVLSQIDPRLSIVTLLAREAVRPLGSTIVVFSEKALRSYDARAAAALADGWHYRAEPSRSRSAAGETSDDWFAQIMKERDAPRRDLLLVTLDDFWRTDALVRFYVAEAGIGHVADFGHWRDPSVFREQIDELSRRLGLVGRNDE